MELNMKDKIMSTDTLKALEANFKELNQKIAEVQKEMREKSTGYIELAAQSVFENCPEVESIFWTQYTPYFNDGEACEFSVNEIYFALEGDEEVDDYEGSIIYTAENLEKAKKDLENVLNYEKDPNAWIEQYKTDYYNRIGRVWSGSWQPSPYPSTSEAAQERVDEIQEFLNKYGADQLDKINSSIDGFRNVVNSIQDDIMQSLFGDHVKITLTRDGMEIDEYNHD